MLRELLQKVGKSSDLNNLSSLDTYILLEALVEAVEPEDTDAAIRKLREERDGANERLEIRRTLCQSWEGRCHKAERELAEAKAEIERVRQRVRVLAGEASRLREFIQGQTLTCDALAADAEIGRLVRGMRNDSQLERGKEYYSVSWVGDRPQYPPGYQGAHGPAARFGTPPTMEPAEALRAIQEVGDAEA